jgi:endoglucanase
MATRNLLPRWRGFNLLEMYTGASQEPFREDDFPWIAQWGFDFVRLPLSYTLWTRDGDPFRIDTGGPALARLDQAVEMGRRHHLHVCLNLHRAPGYCVNPGGPAEPFDLWRDAAALEAFCLHWQTLAERYRAISSRWLSFDLLNEPPPVRSRVVGRLTGALTRPRHAAVMRAAVAAIRQVDPERLLILDGLGHGRIPCPELADLPNVAQSCRAYEPFALSHYRADWVPATSAARLPEWPLPLSFGRAWTRTDLEAAYAPWFALMAQGVGVHCGEAGCYNRTPHAVFLAWLRDVLEVLGGHGIGWALWNFRGPFGVLDSGRSDAVYSAWHGHELDHALLALLQAS